MGQGTIDLDQLHALLKTKPEVTDFVGKAAIHPEIVPLLLDIIRTDKGTTKFFCDKILQGISESEPHLLYPYFDQVAANIDSSNNFIKWGAIITLANLIKADSENKFSAVYEKYLSLINSDSMITAGNAARGAVKIIRSRPDWESDITARLLKVAQNTYYDQGQPSPECKNIMIGHVLDCFDQYFGQTMVTDRMLTFAVQQVDNSRPAVARKARNFLKKHALPNPGQR